ncbi:MAG TPA: uridine kinase [Trueperaceae bacterium]|nr:uridine kinase [Trueperaceae bacterium]
METKPLVIGFAGGTGSGKTTIAAKISEIIGEENSIILPQDAYYRAQNDLPLESRKLTNYDEPSAFDNSYMVEQLSQLIAGQSIERPIYDYSQHNRASETKLIEAKAVILIEGIMTLHFKTLSDLMTLRVFVDAPPDERFIRRLERDVKERGRNAESVINQYRRTVKPMHDLFIEPTKQHADLIVPEGGTNSIAIDVLNAYIDQYLHQLEN